MAHTFASAVTQTVTRSITSFDVEITRLVLFSSVDMLVTLKDANGDYVAHRMFTLAGEEYLAWNNDDSYIVTKVEEKLHADPTLTFA